MINFKEQIGALLAEYIDGLTAKELEEMIEIPTDSKLGDYAFPCFRLAKTMRKSPAIIAKDIAEKLADNGMFERVENVNAYVNMFMNREIFVREVLSEVVRRKDRYGSSDVGRNRKVIVEYSSPNIAKPFHIGHIRSTVIIP